MRGTGRGRRPRSGAPARPYCPATRLPDYPTPPDRPMLLALKVAPQRSTLYAGLARTLAEPELMASPLGGRVQSCEPVRLAGQDYLLVDLAGEPDAADLDVLSRLGATSEVHEYFPAIGDVPGPLLRPVEPTWAPFVPPEIVEARRYRGKTNELFTTVLLNLALFAGDFAAEPAARLRVLDPLAGGGTTLFTALVRGVEDVASHAGYSVILCNTDEDPAKELSSLHVLRRKRVDGIILAKLDGTAKGGVAFSVYNELHVPIWYVGTGEKPEDFAPFDHLAFVNALFE